ncbi:MAG: T9SS type A sorting domain-containing protein [Bacteroidetes bacterium]|nr:T9SS type A sorting domain-containing protein [Bacteroidota bacterium]
MPKFSFSFLFLSLIFIFGISANSQNLSKVNLEKDNYTARLIKQVENIHQEIAGNIQLSPKGRKCLSIVLHEARRNWDKLTNEGKRFFKTQNDRPSGLNETIETSSGLFVIHFTNSGADSVDQTDTDLNGTPDYIDSMAVFLDHIWGTSFSSGFVFPPGDDGAGGDDKYDVYVSNSEAGSNVYGYVASEDFVTGPNGLGDNPNTPNVTEVDSWYSFMVLRNNYIGFGNTQQEKMNALKVTCAHEFMHAIQFGYGTYIYPDGEAVGTMDGFCMEGCATWAEDWIYPGIDDNLQYIHGHFTETDFALNWGDYEEEGSQNPLYDDYSGWWYGGWVFFRYFSEYENGGVMNPLVIREIYEATVSVNYGVAITTMMQTKYQLDLWDLLTNYYLSLCLLTQDQDFSPLTFSRADDYRTYLNGFGITGVEPESTIDFTGNQVIYNSEIDGDGMLMRLGADVIKINSTTDCEVTLTPTTQDAGEAYSLILLMMDAPSNPNVGGYLITYADSGSMSLTLPGSMGLSDYYLIIPAYYSEPAFYNMQYTLTVSPITSVEDKNLVPDEFELFQNYPNPFNPSTKIKFSLPEQMKAKVDVFDVTGSVVSILVDDIQTAGIHELNFDARNLSSGIYFARLITPNGVQVQKMILMK